MKSTGSISSLPNDAQVEQEVLDAEPRSIIMGLIAQLAKGVEVTRVALPTFVLEPRSFTERLTDFMSHPELISETYNQSLPIDRFIDVVRFYLSGFHVRPKGVRKPYNPVIGEFFRCQWDFDNQTAYYICEQVSHHPPSSAFAYVNPSKNLVMNGVISPKAKFLGNSAGTLRDNILGTNMNGLNFITLLNYPDEKYSLSMPNFYARGILFGKMYVELGDKISISCPKNDLNCDIEFKTKGYFSGGYNIIEGKIYSSKENLYRIHGKWSDTIYIINESTNQEEILFSANNSKTVPKIVNDESLQEEYESRRLWSKVTRAILKSDLEEATTHKLEIEDNQRKLIKSRLETKTEWKPRFFEPDTQNKWTLKFQDFSNEQALKEFIFGNASLEEYSRFWTVE